MSFPSILVLIDVFLKEIKFICFLHFLFSDFSWQPWHHPFNYNYTWCVRVPKRN